MSIEYKMICYWLAKKKNRVGKEKSKDIENENKRGD